MDVTFSEDFEGQIFDMEINAEAMLLALSSSDTYQQIEDVPRALIEAGFYAAHEPTASLTNKGEALKLLLLAQVELHVRANLNDND